MAAPPSDHCPIRPRLTSAAQSHAERLGIAATLLAMTFPRNIMTGDHVVLIDEGRQHRFAVMRREWVTQGGEWSLDVTLDHPARPRSHG